MTSPQTPQNRRWPTGNNDGGTEFPENLKGGTHRPFFMAVMGTMQLNREGLRSQKVALGLMVIILLCTAASRILHFDALTMDIDEGWTVWQTHPSRFYPPCTVNSVSGMVSFTSAWVMVYKVRGLSSQPISTVTGRIKPLRVCSSRPGVTT